MQLPKITIVIPSFNQGKYIEESITSILDQHYPSLELIVIDGGSSDDTVQILKKYESEITYWVSEPDNGQAHAINKGLAIATGDIFNWINSDDYLEPGSLHYIGNFFQNNPGKDVLCGYTRCFYDEDNSTSHVYRMGIRSNATETILNLEMNQPGTFYLTNVLKKLGGVNESLRYVFDNELWIRYLGKYGILGIGNTDRLLAQFRLHGSSKSVGDGYGEFLKEMNEIWVALGRQLNLPDSILKLMEKEPQSNSYEGSPFNLKHIYVNKIRAHFSAKYVHTLYISGYNSAAKLAFKNAFKENYLPLNRKFFSLAIRLLFKGIF